MPTRDEIAARVAQNLEDVGGVFFTANDLNASIQDGYNYVACTTGCLPASTSINVDDEIYYNLSSSIADFLYLTAIYDPARRRWLEPTNRKEMHLYKEKWELWTGSPEFYFPVTFNRVAIVPRPTTASGTFTVFYRRRADTLAGSDVPALPTQCDDILELYTTADLLEAQKEAAKASIWWNKFMERWDWLDRSIYGIARAHRWLGMQPFFDMPRYEG